MEIITNTSQILVTIAVAYIAWQQLGLIKRQAYIDKERIKHELFDRRMEFINETKQYIKLWGEEDVAGFDSHIEKAKLLFPESPIAQLVIMKEIGYKYIERSNRKDFHHTETPESRKERIEVGATEELNRHYGRFIQGVRPILKIEEYKA